MAIFINKFNKVKGLVHLNEVEVDSAISGKQLFAVTAFTAAISAITSKVVDAVIDVVNQKIKSEDSDKPRVTAIDDADLTVTLSHKLVKKLATEVSEEETKEDIEVDS